MVHAALQTLTSIASRSVQAEQHFLQHVFEAAYENSVRNTMKSMDKPVDWDKPLFLFTRCKTSNFPTADDKSDVTHFAERHWRAVGLLGHRARSR
jgi:hypothetical protein